MKGFILLILGIIAVIVVVGGVAAVHVMHEAGIEDISPDSVKTLMDKVFNIHSSESSGSSSIRYLIFILQKVQVHPQLHPQVQILHQIQAMSWML